jgi:PPM family protein phosphatase
MVRVSQIVEAADGPCQDRLLILPAGDRMIFAVADGAGGISGGAEAAELAIKVITLEAATLTSRDECMQMIEDIDQAILGDEAAGETTCAIAVVGPDGIFGASVGDSGIWILGETEMDNLTQGQSVKPFLGSGAAVPAGFERAQWDGTLLIATDGLLKYTSREMISTAVTHEPFEKLPEALLRLVRYPSGTLPDDVAIGLCRRF